MIDVAQMDAGFLQAIVDRMVGQLPRRKWHGPLAMLDPCEPLFLRRCQYLAIAHQRGSTVVKGSIDP